MTIANALDHQQEPPLNEPSDVAYHRLARGWSGYRWWKPLVVAAMGAGFYAVFLVIALIAMVVAGLVVPGFERTVDGFFAGPVTLDLNDPLTLVMTLSSVALMLPALWLATLILGAKPVGLLSSIAGRLRWRWLLWCVGVALLVNLIGQGIALAIPGAEEAGATLVYDGTNTLVLLGAALLLVPIQAAAEEYAFRGYLMQTLGGWLRHPAFAILLPVPLFVIGHDYELLGMIDIAIFAVVAGWLTWRTGGLEAAMALHIVNNAGIFVLVAFGAADANADDLGIADLLVSLAMTAVSVVVIIRLARTRRIQRTRGVPQVPSAPR